MIDSQASVAETRMVYPLLAILAVTVAWLLFIVLVVLGAFTLMLVVVTAPAYAAALVGYSGLLSSVHEYARSKAYPVPRRTARTRMTNTLVERRALSNSTC